LTPVTASALVDASAKKAGRPGEDTMSKLTRKQLLKRGAVGAAALVAVPMGSTAAAAEDDEGNGRLAIHIHGWLSGTGSPIPATVKIAVSIDVAGQRRRKDRFEPLTGGGWDPGVAGTNQTTETMVPVDSSGACYFTQAGALDHDEVHLKGFSLFTNRLPADTEDAVRPDNALPRQDTRQDVRSVETRANLKTGYIQWRLGTAMFAGFGVVEKIVG
jgi:hypothetical protein